MRLLSGAVDFNLMLEPIFRGIFCGEECGRALRCVTEVVVRPGLGLFGSVCGICKAMGLNK